MDEDGVSGDAGRPDEEPVFDPRRARARHQRRTAPAAGLLYLREMAQRERDWMTAMVFRTARAYGVNGDDLLQELQLSLLTCDVIDQGREEVRGFLKRRAQWRAADLLRRERSERAHVRYADDGPVIDPPAREPAAPDPAWDVERLCGLSLNRDEAQVVLLTLWGYDVSLREFAGLANRGYAKTRKDRSRGLQKIADLFDLEPEESGALVALRTHRTVTAAAARLGLPEQEFRRRVRRAEKKIDKALGNSGPSGASDDDRDRESEDDSDAR